MKLKSGSVLAILLSVFLGLSSLAQAEQITENSYEDSFPQIKGNYLVWQGLIDGDWEIFLYNINEAEAGPMQITHNNYDDISPQTDGHQVVWVGNSRSGGEIFLYDILAEEMIQITDDESVDSSAQIANGLVVWTSHKVTTSVEPGEILLYDIAHKKTSLLSASVDPDGTLDDSSPRINSESVIWVQADETGNKTIFIHDLATGITTEAPEGFVWEESRQTDGDLAVFSRKVGSNWEIFIRNTSLQNYEQITDNDLEDTYPCLSGNAIAWVSGEGEASEIFLASYAAEPIALLSPQGAGGGGCFIGTATHESSILSWNLLLSYLTNYKR